MAKLDLALGQDRDISLDGSHDLRITAGVDLVTQRVIVGLRLFLGEWFLDTDAGVPYYRDVLTNTPRSNLIEALFRRAIQSDSDIESLPVFSMTVDRRARSLSVAFSAVSSLGPVNARAVLP